MSEPQTLDEVMDGIVPESSEEQETTETQELSNEVEQAQQEEESYTRIDPKTLSPELQAMHKSLLSDYTKKTQSIAQQRKEFEAKQAEIEQLRQQYETQTQQPQQPQAQVPQGVNRNMSVEEYTAFMMSQVEEKLNAHQQQLLEQQEQKYLDNAVKEFEAADERLNPESPAYDEDMRTVVGEKLDKQLHAYQEEHGTAIGFDYQERTQALVDGYENNINEKAKALASQRTQEAFSGVKRTAPMGTRGTQAPSKPSGKMSLDDAVDAAFKK